MFASYPGRRPGGVLLALGLAIAACAPEQTTAPEAGTPGFAKGSGGTVTVSAADPDTVPIDTTLTVRVLGSGFTPGSRVQYAISGVVSSKVTAPAVTYVSATELSTTTVVAKDAPLANYDIVVTTTTGKRGIGAEKFLVVAKPLLLPEAGGTSSQALDVNDNQVIVGTMTDASGLGWALRWTPKGGQWVADILGPGAAVAINGWGDIVRRYSDGTLPRTSIHLAGGGQVNLGAGSYGTGISDDGTVIGQIAASSWTSVVWERTGPGTWTAPIPLPSLKGYENSELDGISSDGRWIAGNVHDTTEWPAVWKKANGSWTSPVRLDTEMMGTAFTVNNTGALAGGATSCLTTGCYFVAVAWPPNGGTRTILASEYWGGAYGMNEAGAIVGWARIYLGKGRGTLADRAVLWPTPTSKAVDLGTGRSQTGGGRCMAVNDTKLAVGKVGGHAMAWLLP